MPTLLSAGISVTESDLIAYVPPVSSSIAAYVGHFNWGPVDELVNVSSEKELATIFGAPNINAGSQLEFIPSYLTAAAFFQYGNSMRVMRAASPDATNSVGHSSIYGYGYGYEDTLSTGPNIKNKEEFDLLDFAVAEEGIRKNELLFARYPGLLGNSLEVQFYHADNASASFTAAEVSALSLGVSSQCKRLFGKYPESTKFTVDNQPDNKHDEIYVAIFDSDGYISGTPGAVLELYQGLSLKDGNKTSTGSNNYYVDVINTSSSFIYINASAVQILATEDVDGFFDLTYTLPNFIFTGGTHGIDGTGVVSNNWNPGNVEVSLGQDFLLDTENTIIDLLCAESFESDMNLESTVKNKLLAIATKRMDLITFISAPLDLYRQPSNKAKYIINGRDNLSNASTSFAFYDNTPVYVYNKYTDKYYWIPACTHMAGLCAYTDAITDPWFSPAGLNRGQLRGVTKLAYNANQQDRDDLYNNNINAIISLPGTGIVLYGDKTGLSRPSSFDRINVRRLFIMIEKACKKASKYQLFELNDEFTQRAFRNTIDPYLRDIKSRRGIIDYAIVCDATNNTPAVVTTNRFVADIYIKPAFSINYIQLNFIATRDTVTFTQISG